MVKVQFFAIDIEKLDAKTFGDSALPYGQYVARLMNDDRLDEADELVLESFDRLGNTFEGFNNFAQDIEDRMPALRDSGWMTALREGSTYVADVAENEPALSGFVFAQSAVLDERDLEQLRDSIAAALEADPAWATEGSGNGPEWQSLLSDLGSPTQYVLAVAY